jgi:L-alanine-DL-glutamate epimerase-like enolase superfamily enzyme
VSIREQRAPIEHVEWREVVVPLSPPILLGSILVAERRYAWVSIQAANGATGSALAFTRGLPVVEMLPMLAPLVVAADGRIDEFNRRVDETYGLAGPNGVVARARSLVDLGLWDLHGKMSGEPVWRLAGAATDTTSVIGVAGYGQVGVDRNLPDELRAWAASGCTAAKIELGGELDAHRDADRVIDAVEAAGDLGVPVWIDVNGAWRPGPEAHAAVARLASAGVALIEEPYSTTTAVDVLAKLVAAADVQIAMGEFDTDKRLFDAYAAAGVDVCRADATLVGGVDAWLAIARRWAGLGRAVFPHFYPEYHLQLVGAVDSALGVELVPEWTVQLDVLRDWPAARDGTRIRCPDGPGFGVIWDLAAVEAHTVRRDALKD